ncbi:NAD(P)H-quinone oxidoreductase [Morganella morganii]|uniref:NAD(P)H-quinone oxidoreductase n=1 Tax=Morganella morganii TaxID=582 RepID=UPI001A18E1EB|nr:NAD(P)H-quinone oxidoreductase [Morganella morganii]MCU6211549.1 NAD(P)H-quinone oxidoreductase [Morganella morganii]MCU6223494.1 NAD(P)H-quinone oxidoreductase [Morganella morganii]MCU6232356.1 NAD(P)H-quinone oxidoreductase [Morganella morganii]MCU6272789.1 NAD(P)H-quinone oxidoreductase [Morganella morganii]HAT1513142.1 NAD(P)H-quinone oxidoreductase [Morganella morganii]
MMSYALPESMMAIDITRHGGPDVLQAIEMPLPKVQGEYLLVKVAAAGVNRPDVFQRQGSYPPPPDASPIPGLEIAGDVVAVGEDCKRRQIGDKVCALVAGGGYAEYCLVHDSIALPLENLSYTEAAAIPENFFTVWANVFQTGKLQSEECVLIHGGTSGIGSVAIMLAKAFGATVYTTVGSSEKAELARQLGADHVINYREDDFARIIPELTGGQGVNMVVDLIGGDYVSKNYEVAAKGGRIIQIGLMRGNPQNLNLMPLMVKRLLHTGSTLRARTPEEKAVIARDLAHKVWPLLRAGKVKPLVNYTFNLADAAKAHQLMESGDLTGKIVLINPDF